MREDFSSPVRHYPIKMLRSSLKLSVCRSNRSSKNVSMLRITLLFSLENYFGNISFPLSLENPITGSNLIRWKLKYTLYHTSQIKRKILWCSNLILFHGCNPVKVDTLLRRTWQDSYWRLDYLLLKLYYHYN